MFDDLAAYFHENILTEFLEYQRTSKDCVAGRSRDLRKALVAATALFHLREHLPSSEALSRAEVERQCPDYAVLGDVVNAAKHGEIANETPHGLPVVNEASRLTERTLVIEYEDSDGQYRHTVKVVIVELLDGTYRNLLDVMTNVINFWEKMLHGMGVLRSARTHSYEEPTRYRKRDECNNGRMGLEIVQGVRFHQESQYLRFNSRTGRAEPVDLTGFSASMWIYKPSFEMEISLTHNVTGKRLKTTVHLSDEESAAISALTSEEERRQFARKLRTVQDAWRKLAMAAASAQQNQRQLSPPTSDA